MEQFDREDSSTYVNNQPGRQDDPVEATLESTPVAPAPQPEPKPKRSKAPLVLSVLLLLALAAAGVFGWLWYQQNGRVDNLESDLSSTRNKVSQLESAAKAEAALSEGASGVSTDTGGSESEAVVKAALAYMEAPLVPLGDRREAKVEYLKGDFAKVTVTPTMAEGNSGGTSVGKISIVLTLKKSNNDWIVFSAAEGPVGDMDELMKTYGIPREAF